MEAPKLQKKCVQEHEDDILYWLTLKKNYTEELHNADKGCIEQEDISNQVSEAFGLKLKKVGVVN